MPPGKDACPASCFWHDYLRALSGEDVVAEDHDFACAVGMQLYHLAWIAEVEVKYLFGFEAVHVGKGFGCQQVVDGR